MKKIALTGIKPTGQVHFGNYLGAIKPAIDLVDQYNPFYFIADYHALTSVKDKEKMKEQIYGVAATWLASGLDPENAVFYRQSDIPEVFELSWILSCLTAKGLLNRAHSYKDAIAKNKEAGNEPDDGVNCGHYNYPILMAADIILFNSHVVPVGQDQKQHLEMARDIAHTFNQTFEEVFILPEPMIRENVKTIPGIDGRKMSKSYDNVIPLYLPTKKLRKRIMQIVTDSKSVEEPKDPDSCNLFAIYSQFGTEEQIAKTRQSYLNGGVGYGHIKQELFEILDNLVDDSREKYNYYMDNKHLVDEILLKGAQKARAIATPTLQKVRQAIGI